MRERTPGAAVRQYAFSLDGAHRPRKAATL